MSEYVTISVSTAGGAGEVFAYYETPVTDVEYLSACINTENIPGEVETISTYGLTIEASIMQHDRQTTFSYSHRVIIL